MKKKDASFISYLHFYVRSQKWTQKFVSNVFTMRLKQLTVPAVSKISSIHCCPSTSTCFRYESSIVGSYFSTNIPWTNWTVRADFPTPPEPSTTILYSRILLWIGRNLSLCKKKITKKYKIMWKWPIALVKRNFAMSIATAHYALISEKKVQFTFCSFVF